MLGSVRERERVLGLKGIAGFMCSSLRAIFSGTRRESQDTDKKKEEKKYQDGNLGSDHWKSPKTRCVEVLYGEKLGRNGGHRVLGLTMTWNDGRERGGRGKEGLRVRRVR